jgi:hypothetical protein
MPDTELLVGAVLALGLLVALAGPPPTANRSYESVLLALAASAMYLVAVVVALTVDVALGTLFAGPGVLAFCASCWLSRGIDRDGGGGDDDDEPDSPIDWDDFDRLRAAWSRPRVTV